MGSALPDYRKSALHVQASEEWKAEWDVGGGAVRTRCGGRARCGNDQQQAVAGGGCRGQC